MDSMVKLENEDQQELQGGMAIQEHLVLMALMDSMEQSADLDLMANQALTEHQVEMELLDLLGPLDQSVLLDLTTLDP